MGGLKKSDEKKFKAICTEVRADGAYIEAGENDNLIVQKLAQNPASIGIFGYSYLDANRRLIRDIPIEGVEATRASIGDRGEIAVGLLDLWSSRSQNFDATANNLAVGALAGSGGHRLRRDHRTCRLAVSEPG